MRFTRTMTRELLAKDIMRGEVVSVPPETDVWDLARLFSTKGITGAPVVDKAGKLLGVVSQTDIIRHLKEVAKSADWLFDFYAEPEPDAGRPRGPSLTAGDLMTKDVITAEEDATVAELAHVMLSKRVHRLIITRGGRISGIVTTMDLLKVR